MILIYTWGTPRQWGSPFVMTTQLPEDSFTKMNDPSNSKDSRENLHDTSYAVDSITDWRTFWKDVLDETEETFKTEDQMSRHKQETIHNFLDTICCGLEEMNGKEVFECFFKAVQDQYEYTKKEHDNTKQLMYLLMELK